MCVNAFDVSELSSCVCRVFLVYMHGYDSGQCMDHYFFFHNHVLPESVTTQVRFFVSDGLLYNSVKCYQKHDKLHAYFSNRELCANNLAMTIIRNQSDYF